MSKIRVLIADSHPAVRSGIRALLELQEDIDVIGEAANGKEAIDMANGLGPDVVLMDVAMPVVDGLGATRRIAKSNPKSRVLILTQHDNREYALSSFAAGASGFMPKKAGPVDLVRAIRAVNRGDRFLHPSMAKSLIKEYLRDLGEDVAERQPVLKEPVYAHTMSEGAGVTRARVSEKAGQVQTEQRPAAQGGSSSGAIPCPAIVGPLIGLVYALIFPFVVFGTLARIGGSTAMRRLAITWRKLAHAHLV